MPTLRPDFRKAAMQTLESLMSLVGELVESPSVQSLIASERLIVSAEEDLEEGEPLRSHLSNHAAGYEFACSLGRIDTLFVHARGKGAYSAFGGTLLHGFTSQSTRTDVRSALGKPSRSAEAQTLPPLGRYGAYDRYDSDSIALHFEYSESDESIVMITVMTIDIAP